MPVNTKLIILWLVCLILIISALFYRLYNTYNNENTDKQNIVLDENNIIPEETNQSFYEDETLVTENKPVQTAIKTETKTPRSPVTAKSYLVGNVITGEIYMTRNKNTVLPVASMSKLITAVESIDQFSLSGTTTVASSTMAYPDAQKYTEGEIFTIEEALYPLLVSSSNIIAETLASTTSRARFMDLMSSYAWEIGMPATYFADPSGLSPQNVSSASDFFALARYLFNMRPDILTITKTPKFTLATTTEHGYREINSTHPFVNEANFLGGKTGRTPQARDTMLTILNIKNIPIAFIVLGSEDRKKDTLYLINQVNSIIGN